MAFLFDFDEVIVDINPGGLKYINEKLKTNYTLDDVTSWDFFNIPEIRQYFLDYLLLPNLYQEHVVVNKKMLGTIKQLVDSGEKVYIVTASVEGSHDSKHRFIEEHMSWFNHDNIYVVNSSSKYKLKSEVIKDLENKLDFHEPIILTDDGIHNVLDMMADIRHKEHLDNMMLDNYVDRKLTQYNTNAFHDLIYGIIPEKTYNKNIKVGKRIHMLHKTEDFFKIYKKIQKNHISRVRFKQSEVFFYLNEMIDFFNQSNSLPVQDKLIRNTNYLFDYYLSNNEHKTFLKQIMECCVKLQSLDIKKIDYIFNRTDEIFGKNIMYDEIKNLIKLQNSLPQNITEKEFAVKSANYYKITNSQQELFQNSVISELIKISKENLKILNSDLNTLNIIDFVKSKKLQTDDEIALHVNFLKSLNENYSFDNGLFVQKDSTDNLFNEKSNLSKPKFK